MKNWKNFIYNASLVIAFHSYYIAVTSQKDSAQDRINSNINQAINKEQHKQLKEKLSSLESKVDTINDRIPNNLELQKTLQDSMDYMERNRALLESLKNKGSKTYESLKKENPNIDFESLSVENTKIFERLQKALNDFNNNSNNLLNNLNEYINAFKDWFNSFSFEQQTIIFNVITLGVILSNLFSLIITFYSDYLIKSTKIEQNYPRLGKFIQLRRNFQNYYFFINSLMLITIIIAAISLNIFAFMSI